MMLTYLYDGSFEGLLTAIYEARYRNENPAEIISKTKFTLNLFSSPVDIATDTLKAEKVLTAVQEKISRQALHHIYYVFLADTRESGMLVYNYLNLGWHKGETLDLYLSDNRVLRVHELARKVGIEKHRLLGLIRFRDVGNEIFYAPIQPDHNIVGLLAPHFVKRLACQRWIIHDITRSLAAVYNKEEWDIIDFSLPKSYPLAPDEEITYQTLWKSYFVNISITERTNLRLQKSFMPQRYWKWLVEKQAKEV